MSRKTEEGEGAMAGQAASCVIDASAAATATALYEASTTRCEATEEEPTTQTAVGKSPTKGGDEPF